MRAVAPMILVTAFTLASRADEPERAMDVFSDADGERTVVYIAPEGAKVAKGQVVCVLDAPADRPDPADRKAAEARAEAEWRLARLAREGAERAVREHDRGTSRKEVDAVDGEVALAEAELKRAEDRYAWSRKMRERRFLTESQAVSDRLNVEKAKFQLEQARGRRAVLLGFTRVKAIKELEAEAEKARGDERAKHATLDALRSARGRSGAAVILAPADGTVRLARPSRLVEPGAEVCEDQLLLRIVPADK